MTLIKYIKSQISKESPVGDLAKDIQGDKEFPIYKPESEIISYLEFKTRRGGISDVFHELMEGYKNQGKQEISPLDIDATFGLFRTETWNFYKDNFPVDAVVLTGHPGDIYKVYCIDGTRKKGLYFNIKSEYNLNDIAVVDQERIHIGNLSTVVPVGDALRRLEACSYDAVDKPNARNFNELLDFLRARV